MMEAFFEALISKDKNFFIPISRRELLAKRDAYMGNMMNGLDVYSASGQKTHIY